MIAFNHIVILICIVLAVFLIFKEIKRNPRTLLPWRVLASVLMLICFALLIVPITHTVKKVESVHELNLLTEGTTLADAKKIKATKFAIEPALFATRKDLKINYLADLNYYLKANPAVKKINVYGYGLTDGMLKSLNNYQIFFHPSAMPSGVISVSWQKKLRISERLNVQGVYHNSTDKSVKLKLYGMGESLDSVIVKPSTQLNFSFTNQPKQSGRAIFSLVALQGKDTLSVEPIPFEVESKQQVQVLILASFPDFEYKFLKQWMYENQFAVATRSLISKHKYSTAYLNMKAVNVSQINHVLLKNFDLLIIDEDELSSLSRADQSSIDIAVNNGMGLIVRLTNPLAKSKVQNFHQYESPAPVEKPLSLKSTDQLSFSNLAFKQTLFLKSGKNNQVLITDETGKIVVNSAINGMGNVLTSTFSSTYQWQLTGKKNDYARFWSLLFNKSLRKKTEKQSFNLFPQFATVGEQARIIVKTTDKTPMLSIDGTKISPRQNMEMPFEWDGLFWSKTAGWHSLAINQKLEHIYIYQEKDWSNAINLVKLNATQNFVAHQQNKDFKTNQIEYLTKEEISKWWFLAGFMLSIAFLWYEQRYLVNN